MLSASSTSTLSFISRSETRRPLSSVVQSEALFSGRSVSGGVLSSEVVTEILFENVKNEKSYLRRYLNDVIEQSTALGCLGEIEVSDETALSLYLRRYLNDADGILVEDEDSSSFEFEDDFAGVNLEWNDTLDLSGGQVILHSDPSIFFYPTLMPTSGWCIQEAQLTFESFGAISNFGQAAGGVFIFASGLNFNDGYFFTYNVVRINATYTYNLYLHRYTGGFSTIIASALNVGLYAAGTVFKLHGEYDGASLTQVTLAVNDVILLDVTEAYHKDGVFGLGTPFTSFPNNDSYWDDFSGFAISCDGEGGGSDICPVDFNEIAETTNSGYLRRYLNDKVS